MNQKIMVGALLSMLSSASFAQMTLDDVNRNLDTYDRYVPPQSEMNQRWDLYNGVPIGTTDGQPDRHWYSHPFSNGTTYRNNNDHEVVINVWGGNRTSSGKDHSNRCQLTIYVNNKEIATTNNANANYGKTCFVSANIPKGATYKITANPWDTWGDRQIRGSIFR